MTASQPTRRNHYVPQWHQRGFLGRGMKELHWLDLQIADGCEPEVKLASPKRLFVEVDLYTTIFGTTVNDEIERFLFGRIDHDGARAVRAFIGADPSAVHERFKAFFEYLDAQRLRTPKGLDWIRSPYSGLGQLDLMLEMQALRQMHCTMWSESVREVVSAVDSEVKFIVTDHPVTIYHQDCAPTGDVCAYPSDPAIEWIGSQTLFPLDADHCLILTHLEHAQGSKPEARMTPRTNSRFRGGGLVKTDAMIRGRKLSDAEIVAINSVLKARARRYVAAGRPEWLFPECFTPPEWSQVGAVLLPRDGLFGFGGEIFIGYKDGTTGYSDAFGRRSRAHEHLQKPHAGSLQPEDLCGCGSGRAFSDCCSPLPVQDRPTWTQRSIRERNMKLIDAMHAIFGFDKGRTWEDARRELSDEQVRQLHGVFGALWPLDTQLSELLPRPRAGITRGLLMADLDPRTVPITVFAMLNYFDELVLPHPFVNPHAVRPEYSPLNSPAKFKEQTIRCAYALLQLEDLIVSGRVHLVPDPMDIDESYRQEMFAIVDDAKDFELSEDDRRLVENLSRDDFLRWVRRMAVQDLRNYLTREAPDIPPAVLDQVVSEMKGDLVDDPMALLQDVVPGEEGAQSKVTKCFNRETGLLVASLTGSIPYTHLRAFVDRLLAPEPGGKLDLSLALQKRAAQVSRFTFPLQLDGPLAGEAPTWLARRRDVIRLLFAPAANGAAPALEDLDRAINALSSENSALLPETHMCAEIEGWIPVGGISRKEVTRLLLTYGRSVKKLMVPAALYLRLRRSSAEAASVSQIA